MHPQFTLWLEQGFNHIASWEALDHILYVIILCLSVAPGNWKKILLNVTAFTIGHSITLLLVSMNIIDVNTKWVEFVIPITIAATAILNIIDSNKISIKSTFSYLLAICFGLIHGMAYGANELSSFFTEKKELLQLTFAFNLGVELAQILFVVGYLSFIFLLLKIKNLPFKWVKISLSSIILIYSIYLAIKNLPS